MSEKLCLQWNDFQENVKNAFGSLRDDNDFTDVTLACEDGQQVKAHKVILAGQDRYHYINTTNINIDDINTNEFKSFTFHCLFGVERGVGGCVWV